jgi:hypothetical protein
MPEIKRTFEKGIMNQDLDERLLPNGTYRDATNVTVFSYASGNIGAVQNGLGNTLKGNIASAVTTPIITNAIVIGAVAYEPKSLIYWLVTCDQFDGIFEYNIQTNQTIRVLQCSKPNPGSPLNFNKDHIVTGINYIEGQDDNNYLFWTDNYNQPRKININRCKGYLADDPLIAKDINVILAPPLNSPYVLMSQDNNPDSTNLKEKFVYFSYRYKYSDNEYSSMAPFSAVGFNAGSFGIDYETGDNLGMVNKTNRVDIHFETGNEFVTEIQLLLRDTRSLNVMIIESFNKHDLNIPNNSTHSFTFRNNKIYGTLSNEQVTRLFDNVPLKSLAQDFIGSRLIYGNYLQFRNISDCNDVDISMNFTVQYASEIITDNNPKRSFRSDRDYEVGIVYTDEFGRMTTVLTPALSNLNNILSNSVYIPPSQSNTANSLQVEIKHAPPCWATNYRLVIKQPKHDYYNIFPRIYVSQGLFRYFLINESDRDKFAVGDYIIVKAAANGPTHSNKQYKILEFELKAAGFVLNAPEGLYFKIKIDPNETFLFPVSGTQTFSWTTQAANQLNCSTGNERNSRAPANIVAQYTSKPVFYGSTGSDSGALSTVITNQFTTGSPTFPVLSAASINFKYFARQDLRYTIEIKPGNKFNYTVDLYGTSNWIEVNDVPIVVGQVYRIKVPSPSYGGYGTIYPSNPINNPNALGAAFFIQFNGSSYSVGDRWKISGRSMASGFGGGNYFGSSSITNSGVTDYSEGQNGGMAIVSGEFSGPVYAGASISIRVKNDRWNSNAYSALQSFTSPQEYKNIEEWFVESGAFASFQSTDTNGVSQGSKPIWFRETSGPVLILPPIYGNGNNSNTTTIVPTSPRISMFMMGYGNKQNCRQNIFEVEFIVNQITPSSAIICETVPLETDVDIFHELSKTYPIINKKHISRWFFSTMSLSGGGTRLRQTTKEWAHYFSVGETVYVKATGVVPNTQFTIVSIPDRYSIVVSPAISLPPSYPGSVSYTLYEQDQTSVTNAAKIQINYPKYPNSNYNSFTYKSGLESYRIKDAFNAAKMEYSIRATTIIEDYEEERKFASLTYSGIFQATTSTNRLNEFNLSLANFKNLDKRYGGVQKLKARDTDLLTLHQDKVTSVLYGKNLLYDAVGGSQIASIPEVLGNQVAYPGEFGISNNPESFTTWGDVCYFADEKRGSVLKLLGTEVTPISSLGMGAFWIDTMRDNSTNFKFGGFDPYNGLYVLNISSRVRRACDLTLSPSFRNVTSSTSPGQVFMFSINSTASYWQVNLVDNGFGTNWVTLQTMTGSFSQLVYALYASNPGMSPRSVIFRVTYCDTLVKDFILTQGGASAPVVVIPMVNG